VPTPSSDKLKAQHLPLPLTSMQVDLTTRMGALAPATTTGFGQLDQLLLGGLRTGTLVTLSGPPGCGKTAMALLMAYMAARARAAVMFCSAFLDETDVMARLAARAMYREYPEADTPYGAIWSGDAWQDDFTRQAVSTSVNVALRKVGNLLHLYRFRALETASEIANAAAHLWSRFERVVVVVDGIEALCAAAGGDMARAAGVNSDYQNRLSQVANELKQVADGGCAVVVTSQQQNQPLLAPVATASLELADAPAAAGPGSARDWALGARQVILSVTKNRVGPTASIPLRFIAGASVFEQISDEPSP
jgi:replicative DNA helicase